MGVLELAVAGRGPPARRRIAADRADRPEQLRGDLVKRIVAQVDLLDVHARELVLALGQVVLDVLGHVPLDGDVRVRQLRLLLGDLACDLLQAAHADARNGAAAALRRDAEYVRKPREHHRVRAGRVQQLRGLHAHGQVGRRDHDRDRPPRVDQHIAAAVDDLAPRRGDRDLPSPVGLRLREVILAREHLQEPKPEEDDREQRERERADHRDSQRELRRERRTAIFGQLDHRVERGIGPRRSDGRCSGLSPPVV